MIDEAAVSQITEAKPDARIASAAELELVFDALWVAWKLGVGVPVAGARVTVPDEIGRLLDAQRSALAAVKSISGSSDIGDLAAPVALAMAKWPAFEVERRIAFMLEQAGRVIADCGDDTGMFAALRAGRIEPDTSAKAEAEAAQREWARQAEAARTAPRVEDMPGSEVLRISQGGRGFEVRSSDGKSWFVVRDHDNTLLSWHPSREAARGWVLAGLADGSLLRGGRL